MDDEQRQWEAIEAAAPSFIGLTRDAAEKLATGLGLHPRILDWDVIEDEVVALGFTTRRDIITLHLKGGVVTRAHPD